MAATQGIRPATEGELDLLPSVYERASFNPRLAAVDRFARAALGGEVFVVEREGGLAGASGCAHFGATGWVGAVAVVPEARRAGLGRALTEAAVAWLRERGAGTIQLYATDMGRPIYERLGFVAEGACVALGGRWQPGPPTATSLPFARWRHAARPSARAPRACGSARRCRGDHARCSAPSTSSGDESSSPAQPGQASPDDPQVDGDPAGGGHGYLGCVGYGWVVATAPAARGRDGALTSTMIRDGVEASSTRKPVRVSRPKPNWTRPSRSLARVTCCRAS